MQGTGLGLTLFANDYPKSGWKPRTRFEGQPGIYFQLCVAEGD